MKSQRDSDFIKGRRGNVLAGASSGYEVSKRCPFNTNSGDINNRHPKPCGEPMKYSIKRKTWYCPIHGAQI